MMSEVDRSHLLPDEDSNAFMVALGRLTIYWGTLDRELSHVVAPLVGATEAQGACISTEIPDVSGRCRLIKSLSYAIDAPQNWRDDVATLANRISNDLGPKRNRYIHDVWVEDRTAMKKIDRRAKVIRAQSFQAPQLRFDTHERLTVDDIDTLAVKIIHDATNLATMRFDLESWQQHGIFPSEPQLERWRVKRTDLISFSTPAAA